MNEYVHQPFVQRVVPNPGVKRVSIKSPRVRIDISVLPSLRLLTSSALPPRLPLPASHTYTPPVTSNQRPITSLSTMWAQQERFVRDMHAFVREALALG